MPNIIQTANITVNAVVDQVRTRLAPTGWLSWDVVVGASVAGVLTTCSLLQALKGSGCMAETLLVQSPRDARLRPCEALRGIARRISPASLAQPPNIEEGTPPLSWHRWSGYAAGVLLFLEEACTDGVDDTGAP
jgi:hypothetical protein